MAERSIVVRLKAVVDQFKQGMNEAAKKTDDLKDKTDDLGKKTEETQKKSANWEKIGGAVAKGVALAAAGLVMATKAAIDWEQSWAGVQKTVDGTPEQMRELEGSLREMARTLPASHNEIAAIAEAAGQLGVKTKDVAGFTRVMIDLAETTNLTADEAATSLAQFMNVMGTSGNDVSRLGASVVALGNAGASTERDIVQMAQRIAGAGKQVGLSEHQVLAFASALSSVGIEAEAGGTAISSSFLRIDAAVRSGAEDLQTLADISGMTADEFKRAYQNDAAGALSVFLKGLNAVGQKGADVTGILDGLGVKGIREADALRRLAASGNLLSDSLDLGAESWRANTALVEEAMKRYETTGSKVTVATNRIKDATIEMGGAMLPVVASLAETIGGLADGFGKLPAPVKSAVTALGGVVAVGGLAGGGLIKAATSGVELWTSFKALRESSPQLAERLQGLGKAAIALGAAFTVAQIAQADWDRKTQEMISRGNDIASSLMGGRQISLDQMFQFEEGVLIKERIRGIGDAMKQVLDPGWMQTFNFDGGVISRASAQFKELDRAMTAMSQGGAGERAASLFRDVAAAAEAQGISVTRLVEIFPEYKRQLQQQAEAAGHTALSTEELVAWMAGKLPAAMQGAESATERVTRKMADQKKVIGDVTEVMFAYANQIIAISGSEIGFEAAIDGMTEALKANGKTLDVNTEKGRANKSALNSMATASLSYIEALIGSGAETSKIVGTTERARAEFVKAATAMGMSKKAAEDLASSYGLVPSEVKTTITAPGVSEARGSVEDFRARLSTLPKDVATYIQSVFNTSGVDQANAILRDLDGKTVYPKIKAVYTGTVGTSPYALAEARGGVVDYYASGGLRERHVAQIAPAGSWRVWAEPETGGEAYIPLAAHKRARSLDIWAETGRRLGVRGFADGGFHAAAPQVSVGAPAVQVYVQAAPDGAWVRSEARVVVGQELASVARASRRNAL